MAYKVIRNFNHSRLIGEKDGKKIYASVKIGSIARNEQGVEVVYLDYWPTGEGTVFCNKPKEKEEKPF